jgi:hypothetical protein
MNTLDWKPVATVLRRPTPMGRIMLRFLKAPADIVITTYHAHGHDLDFKVYESSDDGYSCWGLDIWSPVVLTGDKPVNLPDIRFPTLKAAMDAANALYHHYQTRMTPAL